MRFLSQIVEYVKMKYTTSETSKIYHLWCEFTMHYTIQNTLVNTQIIQIHIYKHPLYTQKSKHIHSKQIKAARCQCYDLCFSPCSQMMENICLKFQAMSNIKKSNVAEGYIKKSYRFGFFNGVGPPKNGVGRPKMVKLFMKHDQIDYV